MVVVLLSTSMFAQGFKQQAKDEHRKNSSLGKDILTFYPFQIMVTNADQEDVNLNIGVSYERILNNELIGIKLAAFRSLSDPYYYFTPTLKIYPFHQGTVRFAVGPQLIIGMGSMNYSVNLYDPNNGYYTQHKSGTRKQFGFAVSPSLNVTMSEHFYITAESSLGIMYYDNMPYANSTYYNYNYSNNPVNPAFQLNFGMGYRF